MKTVLVTAFEPFGGETINPSWEAVRALEGKAIGGARIVARQLPVVFSDVLGVLYAAMDEVEPDLILSVGQAGGRSDITVERIGINVDDARIADNAGQQPVDEPIVADGPAGYFSTLSIKAIVAAVRAAADHQVVITTPDCAPDPPLLDASVAAARRGVDLSIIFPNRNDSFITGAISRAYYPVLARAGARIFEFRGGLLHAKTLVVDGALMLVGSANMDRRSLDLNFENNMLIQSPELAEAVSAHQRRWLADAIEISPGGVTARSLPRRFFDNLLTMAAPLF